MIAAILHKRGIHDRINALNIGSVEVYGDLARNHSEFQSTVFLRNAQQMQSLCYQAFRTSFTKDHASPVFTYAYL